MKHIQTLAGPELLNAIRNYISFIESDMDPDGWNACDHITFNDFIYNIQASNYFNERGEIE